MPGTSWKGSKLMGQTRGRVVRFVGVAIGAALGLSVLGGLGAPSAAEADGQIGTGGAHYSVQVVLTGNGLGSGGSLGVPGSSGYTVSIPTLCGYSRVDTQAYWEHQWLTDDKLISQLTAAGTLPKDGVPTAAQAKAFVYAQAAANDLSDGIGYENYKWLQGMADNWGKSGSWYIDGCTGTQSEKYFNAFAHNNPPVLSGANNPPVPNSPPIPPGVLIRAAEHAMTLPHVQWVGINPQRRSFVKLPTYVWAHESAPLAVGDVKSVTATVQAGGPVQSATVTATYRSTDFSSTAGSTGCPARDDQAAKSLAHGSAYACRSYTESAPVVTVTASPQWDTAGRECLPGCRPVAVPGPVGIEGTGTVSVAEIQTIDR